MTDTILEVSGLNKAYRVGGGLGRSRRQIKAVDGVSFAIKRGETLGLIGESGCGKSTVGRMILRLLNPDAGTISVEGRDIANAQGRALHDLRRKVQMIFQDPAASLNPYLKAGKIVGEPLENFERMQASERQRRIETLFSQVGLNVDATQKFSFEFSGGQRQRLGIARALAASPLLIVADEPVSALDVSVQAQIVNLMVDLQAASNLSYLFISHDLSVVRYIAHRVADITDRVERRDREARQSTLSALGQLASGVAHEVNNLLHPMVNLAQRVRDKHTSDAEARKLLDLVVASGKHAGEIVAGVLNAFNPVRSPGERQPIAVALQSALDTVRPTVPATVRVTEAIAASPAQSVPPGEMLQVISNLLSNAIRAMDGAGDIAISLADEADGATVLIFADNGPGMPEQIRRRASEPFVTGRADGTGLGLAVVANIVRNWKGEMDIRSVPDQGTVIRIRMEAFRESADE